MSKERSSSRVERCVSAMALGALPILIWSPPASAGPPFPLGPACADFGFDGSFSLRQSNGFTLSFDSTGPNAAGRATAVGTGGATQAGNLVGGVIGRVVDFNVDWSPASRGHYKGTVGDDGMVVNGTTTDVLSPSSTATWQSTVPLVCLTKPAAPAPRPPANRPAPGFTDPRGDDDGDGLFNEDEKLYGTKFDVADSDADGIDDGQEVFDGTDPVDPNDP